MDRFVVTSLFECVVMSVAWSGVSKGDGGARSGCCGLSTQTRPGYWRREKHQSEGGEGLIRCVDMCQASIYTFFVLFVNRTKLARRFSLGRNYSTLGNVHLVRQRGEKA